MNKIYKVVWSKAKNCHVVVSELAKSHTKAPKSGIISKTVVAGVLACVLSGAFVFSAFAEGDASKISADSTETVTGADIYAYLHQPQVFLGTGTSNLTIPSGSNAYNFSIGKDIDNQGALSVAIGYGSKAYGTSSLAINGGTAGDLVHQGGTANAYNGQIAIGSSSIADGNYAIAIGSGSKANGVGSVGLGRWAYAKGSGSVAVGDNIKANTADSVAIGKRSEVNGYQSTSLGSAAKTSGFASVALGFGSSDEGLNNVVSVGARYNPETGGYLYRDDGGIDIIPAPISGGGSGNGQIAGDDPYANIIISRRIINMADGVDDTDAATVGQVRTMISNAGGSGSSTNYVGVNGVGSTDSNYTGAGAGGAQAIAIGSKASSATYGGLAIGAGAKANEIYSTAMGAESVSGGQGAVALGLKAKANGNYNTALGTKTDVKNGEYNVALGYGAKVGPLLGNAIVSSATSLGAVAQAEGNRSVALGMGSYSKGTSSVGLGENTKVYAKNSVAIGASSMVRSNQEDVVSFGYDAGTLPGGVNPGSVTYVDENGVLMEIMSSDTIINQDPPEEEYKRRLIHVADGIDDSDVATVGQLNAAIADISSSGNIIGSNNTVSDVSDVVIHGDNNTVSNPASFYGYTDGNVADGVLKNVVLIGNNSSASVTNVSSPRATRNIYSDSIGIGVDSDGNMSQVPIEYNRIENVVGIGNDVKIADSDTVAIGHSAKALGHYGTAIGGYSEASYEGGVAVGYAAKSSSLNTTALGLSAKAESSYATALGAVTSATNQATAIGYGSKATARGDLVAGYTARTTTNSENSVVLGSSASGSNKNVVATGYLSKANGLNSVALGSGATANNTDSIAVGSDSIAKEDNVVSFGHDAGDKHIIIEEYHEAGYTGYLTDEVSYDSDLNRRLTHIADGINDNDAATVGQMNRVVADFATSDSLDTKANIDLDNISDNGVNVVSAIAQRSTKVIAGQNTNVTVGDDNGTVTYAVNLATNGAIAEGNEGIVTGGAIYDALQNVSANIGEITPYTAGDSIAISNTKQISVVKDGEVEHGNIGLVTGGQVYDKLSAYNENLTDMLDGAISSIEDDLGTKAKSNLSNLDNSGKNVIRGLAQQSVKVVPGENTGVTISSENGALTYAVDVHGLGTVSENNTGLVTGGTLYNEVRPANGNYIANNKTVAENLTVLDTSIKNVSDRVDALGGTIADTTVVRYDSNTKDKLTLNGTQGTTLTNLKNGAVTASSTDAVTGSQLYSVKRSVDDHTTAINTLQGNVTENANAISSLDGRVTSMEDMVTNAFNATEELQTTVGGLETTVGNMQTTVNEMQDTVSGLATDVNNVKSAVTDLEGDFTVMQENVSDLQNGLGSVQNDVSDVKETLGTVQADTTQIKENVTALQSNVSTLQQDVETKANADGSNIDVAKFIEKMKVEENGIVTKDDLHAETRVEEDGFFVKKVNSLQDNLLALDNGMSDLRNSIPKEMHGMSVNFKNTNDANYNGSGAIGDNALAVGPNAEASGEDAIAIGHGSKASGLQSIAVGTGNEVSGNHSGAFGDPNDVSGDNSYVIGNDNTVSGNNTFVLGNNVTNATGNNSVVLGADSDGSQDNVVSVGKEGAERKIVHVAEGSIEKDSTDAVTGGQLYDIREDFRNAQGIDTDKWANALGTGTVSEGDNDLVTGGTVYDAIKDLQTVKDIVVPDFSSGNIQIAGSPAYDMIDTINVSKSDGSGRVITGVVTNPEDVTSAANVGYVNAVGQTIVNGVNNAIYEVDTKANKIGASAAAMASLEAPPMDGDEKWAFSASVGHYRGETAGAVGAYYRPQDNIMLNVKGAVGNGEDMIGGGVGIALQRGNSAGLTKASLAKAVNSQARVIEEMKAEREADKAEIAELKAMVQQLAERQAQTEQRNAQ